MFTEGCMYCEMNETVDKLMTQVEDLRVSRLFLLSDQSFTGRCVLALKDHLCEADELSEQQRFAYFQDLADSVTVIRRIFKPDKINYAIFGDLVPHFHMHLVPKYTGKPLWGKPYCAEVLPPVLLSEEEAFGRILKMREVFKTIRKVT